MFLNTIFFRANKTNYFDKKSFSWGGRCMRYIENRLKVTLKLLIYVQY